MGDAFPDLCVSSSDAFVICTVVGRIMGRMSGIREKKDDMLGEM